MYILKIQPLPVAIVFLTIVAVLLPNVQSRKIKTSARPSDIFKRYKEIFPNGHDPLVSNIINGREVNIEERQYLTYVADRHGLPICSASLVHKQFLVSAAHCFFEYVREVGILQVVANSTYQNKFSTSTKVNVSDLYLPSEYHHTDPGHMDIAVLKLKEPLVGIPTVDMCTDPLEKGDNITVMGWGKTSFEGTHTSNSLQEIEVPVISKEVCLELFEDIKTPLSDTVVCAGLPGDKDACQGDSGGPAVRDGKLCGIVSWGVGCADAKLPGIYTSIPYVRGFIDKVLANDIDSSKISHFIPRL